MSQTKPKAKRVLGNAIEWSQSPNKNLNSQPVGTADSKDTTSSSSSASPAPQILPQDNSNVSKLLPSYNCPICNESTLTLVQLNQHIDDVHTTPSPTPASRSKATPPRKINKISYSENNRGFSIADATDALLALTSSSSTPPPSSSQDTINSPKKQSHRITRTHWKSSENSSQLTCHIKDCDKSLNIKNGIVNCRKCGELYCNDHTHYKIRLRNPHPDETSLPKYDSTQAGIWCRCCVNCYFDKPDLKLGTDVNYIDLTSEFRKKRQDKVELYHLNRNKIQKHFIKLTNLLAEQRPPKWSIFNNFQLQQQQQLDSEREIVGFEDWQADLEVSHCSICFVKFNLLNRRHHCRLCGSIVCDDPNGFRKSCSIYVPLNKLLDKLPSLNYSTNVKNNWQNLIHEDSRRFRCCVNCKDSLLYDWKRQRTQQDDQDTKFVFSIYETILLQKSQISFLLPKYEALVHGNDEVNKNKLRHKLMVILKDFENSVVQFRSQLFITTNDKLVVNPKYIKLEKVISNIYQSIAIYLQDNIIQYKQISEVHKTQEQEELKRIQKENTPEIPRLTKKQIRELRDQLMVMNEQKFLVENLITEYTKARRFDELSALINNKKELQETIDNLEKELGEFGF
ncbi:Vacuolar segregation protein PEP7 [Spathaspora sp. JA1]|nr:Vacuolar segregation protein PEP7 [Spathaspora sp. JA1]